MQGIAQRASDCPRARDYPQGEQSNTSIRHLWPYPDLNPPFLLSRDQRPLLLRRGLCRENRASLPPVIGRGHPLRVLQYRPFRQRHQRPDAHRENAKVKRISLLHQRPKAAPATTRPLSRKPRVTASGHRPRSPSARSAISTVSSTPPATGRSSRKRGSETRFTPASQPSPPGVDSARS